MPSHSRTAHDSQTALLTIKGRTQSASHWSKGNPQMQGIRLRLMIARQTIAFLAPLPLVKRGKCKLNRISGSRR